MSGWAVVWKVVFALGVSAFALLSVWVTVFGLGDIKRMFEDLGKQDQ